VARGYVVCPRESKFPQAADDEEYLLMLVSSFVFTATAAMAIPFSQPSGQDNYGQQDNHDNHGGQDNHGQHNHGRQDNRGGRGSYVMHDRGQHEG
jgi:hypothetical protein